MKCERVVKGRACGAPAAVFAVGQIVEGAIAVVPYIDGEGESRWMVWWRCDLPVSQMVGLLEMAKLHLLQDFGVFDPGEGEL